MNGAQMLLLRILVGAVSGGMASFCSCPIEVCLVRMQVRGKELEGLCGSIKVAAYLPSHK